MFSGREMLTIILLAIFVEVNTLKVAQNTIENANGLGNQNNATENISAESSLFEKYNRFNKKYARTLMNSMFLPFVDSCNTVMKKSQPVYHLKAKDRFLCLTYFDMINNLMVNANEDFMLVDKVNISLIDYDNTTLVDNFCEFFGGELPIENVNRQFLETMLVNPSAWMNAIKTPDKCRLYCYDSENPIIVRILPICKLISGGYRLIKKHLADKKSAVEVGKLTDDSIQKQLESSKNTSARLTNEVKQQQPTSVSMTNTSRLTTTVKNYIKLAGANSSSSKPAEDAKKNTSPMAKPIADVAVEETPHESKDDKENLHNEEAKQVANGDREVEDINEENGGLGKKIITDYCVIQIEF